MKSLGLLNYLCRNIIHLVFDGETDMLGRVNGGSGPNLQHRFRRNKVKVSKSVTNWTYNEEVLTEMEFW